jgi:hypothetical protein
MIQTDLDPGAQARNEAILLLGCFSAEARGILGAPSPEWAEFVAEAARMWRRIRPEQGLSQVDRSRGGRAADGFALEAWGRERLNLPPLHPDYVTSRVRGAFFAMVGYPITVQGTSP